MSAVVSVDNKFCRYKIILKVFIQIFSKLIAIFYSSQGDYITLSSTTLHSNMVQLQ